MNKVICIIDGGFIKKAVKSYGVDLKINHEVLTKKMAGDIPLLRSYYYDCPPYKDPTPTEMQRKRQADFDLFKNTLLKIPQMEIRLGRLKRTFENSKPVYSQKGVDTLMAIDLVTFSTKRLISHAVLMTGDSDLVPAVQIAKDEGVIVKVVAFAEHPTFTATQLTQTVDIVEQWSKAAVISACCADINACV